MMQYRTSQNRDRCTNSRSLNSDGSGQSRYAAWVNAHNPASSGSVPRAWRKKFGSTPKPPPHLPGEPVGVAVAFLADGIHRAARVARKPQLPALSAVMT